MEDNTVQGNPEEMDTTTDNGASLDRGSAEQNDITENEAKDGLKAELEEQKDKYLRLFAEFDNYKRRNSKERLELIQTAGKEVITSLLDVLDDCDRAENQLQQSDNLEQAKEGVLLVFNKLRNTLQNRGLKPMDSIGEEFDVEKHEAITGIPVEDEEKKGTVIDVVQRGYYLNDKLIRFAKVVVGK